MLEKKIKFCLDEEKYLVFDKRKPQSITDELRKQLFPSNSFISSCVDISMLLPVFPADSEDKLFISVE